MLRVRDGEFAMAGGDSNPISSLLIGLPLDQMGWRGFPHTLYKNTKLFCLIQGVEVGFYPLNDTRCLMQMIFSLSQIL